jgi:hypothetical protein
LGNLEWATKFWVGKRKASSLVLARGTDGIPIVPSRTCLLLRVAYLSAEIAGAEQGIRTARGMLDAEHPTLLLSLPCPDGPPYRAGVLFGHSQTNRMPWFDGSRAHSPIQVDEYRAAMNGDYVWSADVRSGRPGYLVTGHGDTLSFWRIARVEDDIIGRQVFTLSPVQLASGLPAVDFTSIEHPLLREKLAADWAEVQTCFASHSFSALVTPAKNIGESLALYALGAEGNRTTFAKALDRLREKISSSDSKLRLPLQPLDYHLLSKMRILHSNTHPDKIVISGRILDPDFCLSVVADLVQVLRSCNLVRKS